MSEQKHNGERFYRVPVSAHGGVYVRATSPEEAFKIADAKARPADADLSMDIDRGYLEMIEPVENPPTYRNVVNESNERGRNPHAIPNFPTVKRLRLARESMGVSQREIADRIGVSSRTVSHYENENISITLSRARDYAAALRSLAVEDANGE